MKTNKLSMEKIMSYIKAAITEIEDLKRQLAAQDAEIERLNRIKSRTMQVELERQLSAKDVEIEFQKSEVSRLQAANKMIVETTQRNLDEMRKQLSASGLHEPSEEARRTLNNPPERIYLQVGDDYSDFPGEIHWRDVTWCKEMIGRYDLTYVRSDLIARYSGDGHDDLTHW
jgi:hypothetical protein